MLKSALHSLIDQSLDKQMYEIVVVDNASKDDTQTVINEMKTHFPGIASVFEAKQGLGHARNAGYKQAKGTYVAFIDDDCLASNEWLQHILHCYEQVKPEPWSVGGLILPVYNTVKPNWFKDRYETDSWGEQPRYLLRGESFTGCNMSFRKSILQLYGGFDVAFDMKGDGLSLAGETELFRRMWLAEGHTCRLYYSPKAVVRHVIDPYKMTVAYQLKRAFTAGQASYAMSELDSRFRKCILFFGTLTLLTVKSLMALMLIRLGRHRRNWAVEALYPVASQCGRLLAFFGVKLSFRQRASAPSMTAPGMTSHSSYAS